jgi:hypothetical protein
LRLNGGIKRNVERSLKKLWRVKEGEQGTWNFMDKKLKKSKGELMQWQKKNGRKTGGIIQQMTENTLMELNKSESVDVPLFLQLKPDLAKLQDEEDLYWCQRAKIDWMKLGIEIRNFSTHVLMRKKEEAKLIHSISDKSGAIWKSHDQIGMAFVRYFTTLFTVDSVRDMRQVIETMDP